MQSSYRRDGVPTVARMSVSPEPPARYDDLTAIYLNCTLTPSPGTSNTKGLMDRSASIMRAAGVDVDMVRLVDHDIAPGVQPDMRDDGFPMDAWPELWPRIAAADILVVCTPIWLGDSPSVLRRLIERLDAMSSETNNKGQFVYYGKVAATIITGNEDGLKHVAMSTLFALQHIGCTIPPGADAGWVGEAGPGPSYLDEDSGGPENDFTNQNTTFLTWNLLHLARLLKDAGGYPAYGNVGERWEAGERFGYPDLRT